MSNTPESAKVAIVIPMADLHEESAMAARLRSGLEGTELYFAQDTEPPQRYTRTVNRGLRQAFACGSPDYVCLLNDDCRPGDNWLAELVWCMEQDEKLGYVAPAQPCRTQGMMQATGPTDEPEIRHIFAVPFGCVLIRREVFTDVGLLDPTFVHYCSDTDHQYRARGFGWKSAWAPHIWVDRDKHDIKLPELWRRDRYKFYRRWP